MIEILDVALLRLRFQSSCGLDLDLNLPFLTTHSETNPQPFSGAENGKAPFLARFS
jgi:hypothetical protein